MHAGSEGFGESAQHANAIGDMRSTLMCLEHGSNGAKRCLIRIKLIVKLHNLNLFPQVVLLSLVSTVSHFSYAPFIKYKTTRKRNIIFSFCDYQRKAYLYLHQPLKFYCDQIRNK